MKSVMTIISDYLEECKRVFKQEQEYDRNIIPFPGIEYYKVNRKALLEKAILKVENSLTFNTFLEELDKNILNNDLDRLIKDKKIKQDKIREWRRDTSKNAASRLFKNTGTYLLLWKNLDYNLQLMLDNIQEPLINQKDSQFYKLFVLDGFNLYDNNLNMIETNNVILPNGVLKKYTKKEIERLLMIPQSNWHDSHSISDIEELSSWNILTVTRKEPYRGKVAGLLLYNLMLSPDDRSNRDNSLINTIGPLFLCIGEDANLAEEIWVRSNVFDAAPILSDGKNYLPWDSIDEDGNINPRCYIKYVGDDGCLLRNIYNKWNDINELDEAGFLKHTTELYFWTIMNLHKLEYSLSESFISLVTLIEAILTPGSRSDLTYKTAARGAAILSTDFTERIALIELLQEYYNIRSSIVHEGHAGEVDLINIIQGKLLTISRQIFLRYIALISLAINNKLPPEILDNPQALRSRKQRSKIISKILNAVLMGTEITNLLELELENWGFILSYSNHLNFKVTN